jgi:subtilisin family serine protease
VLAKIPLIDVLVAEIPKTAVPGLQHNPNVRYIETDLDGAVWTQEDTLVYGVDNIDAEVVWGGAENATNVISGKGGAGIKVAIIDTGIDCGHPDLTPNCVYGVNKVSKGNKGPFDDHGHGTHVAGIVAARDNGFGVIGVAPKATLYAVKVLDANGVGFLASLASGIAWATRNKMDVINMSLGGSSFSQAVADAVEAASAAGVLVVSAAGNRGCCDTVLYPAKLPESMVEPDVDLEGPTAASGDHARIQQGNENPWNTPQCPDTFAHGRATAHPLRMVQPPQKQQRPPWSGPLTIQMHGVYACCSKHRKRGVNPLGTALGLASVREKCRGPPS